MPQSLHKSRIPINRYHDNGVPGCGNRSRAPRAHPNATDPKLAARIVKLRKKHPGWGPITLHAVLREEYPRTAWRPARTKPDRPNRVWSADFKGQFRLGNGALCYPLTIADAYSRYLLACHGLKGTALKPARRVFEEAFREFGLPEVIHTDNGVPFCVFLTEALRSETLGFEHVADAIWSVFFGDVMLGRFNEAEGKFVAGTGR